MLESLAFLQFFPVWAKVLSFCGVLLISGFYGFPLIVWSSLVVATMVLLGASPFFTLAVAVVLLGLNLPFIRRIVMTGPVFKMIQSLGIMPAISQTEKTALEAGATWVDADLFSGKPDLHKLANEPISALSEEEKAFLNGPVEKICEMVDDWEVFNQGDLPQEIWDYIAKERFFGMIIPKEYGGLEFSAQAHSAILTKLGARCVPLAITVMVPNSLGPAELIYHYGTQKQKDNYLPRLADGREIPCFGLTEPHAGSDAGSIQSAATVFKNKDGKICLRINWEKRYITLASVSTIIGLAVQLKDPDNILGKGEDLGITCVLVPSNTKGVSLGLRHNPLAVPFFNCPTTGKDVEVSIEQVIGGVEGCGKGWTMLMESLAAGRSISLPALANSLGKSATKYCSAYSRVRKQFGMPIEKFEGVEEKLARIYGLAYILDSTAKMTVSAVDKGIKPAVVSAIAKYQSTELQRIVINDAMDVVGGAGISRGPRNHMAHGYFSTPISITVEGANILTRTMIIFGQGALRCHPYAYKEFKAVEEKDLAAFDTNFVKHMGFVMRNTVRSFVLSLTRGYVASTPSSKMKRYYQKLAWVSASFAAMADIALASYGGKLKQKESITGRYADVLCWMYFSYATLRRFRADGEPDHQLNAVKWALDYSFFQIQTAFDGIYRNIDLPVPGLTPIFRKIFAFWSHMNHLGNLPGDDLSHKLVRDISEPARLREEMIQGLYEPKAGDPKAIVEEAYLKAVEAAMITKKIRKAIRSKDLPKGRPENLIDQAVEKGIITSQEALQMKEVQKFRSDAIQVDSFEVKDYNNAALESA